MKSKLAIVVICALAALATTVFAAEDAPSSQALKQQFLHIDLELALQHYKEVQSELFKTELRLKLIGTEGIEEAARKEELKRLQMRVEVLRTTALEIRRSAQSLREELVTAK